MKDLFVLTADSDAQALVDAILRRPRDLGIRPIEFEVRRFPGRDSGMVKEGPETARAMVRKAEYARLILIWDHHGSGWDRRDAGEAAEHLQRRLDGATWRDNSGAIVIVPELEGWLWGCSASLARYLGLGPAAFRQAIDRAATRLGSPADECCRDMPKEIFEEVLYHLRRRRPLPEDFRLLASGADLSKWVVSPSFATLVATLRKWFPVR